MHMPACFAAVIRPFAPVFVQQRVWCHAELLLIGAVLAPGRRTVASSRAPRSAAATSPEIVADLFTRPPLYHGRGGHLRPSVAFSPRSALIKAGGVAPAGTFRHSPPYFPAGKETCT